MKRLWIVLIAFSFMGCASGVIGGGNFKSAKIIKTGNQSVDNILEIHQINQPVEPGKDVNKKCRDMVSYYGYPVESNKSLFDEKDVFSNIAISFVRRYTKEELECIASQGFLGKIAASTAGALDGNQSPVRERVLLHSYYEAHNPPSYEAVNLIYKNLFKNTYPRSCYMIDTEQYIKNKQVSSSIFINIEELKPLTKLMLLPVLTTVSKEVKTGDVYRGGRKIGHTVKENRKVSESPQYVERAVVNALGGLFKEGVYKGDKNFNNWFLEQYQRHQDSYSTVDLKKDYLTGETNSPLEILRTQIAEGKYPSFKNNTGILFATVYIPDPRSDDAEYLRRAYDADNAMILTVKIFNPVKMPTEIRLFGQETNDSSTLMFQMILFSNKEFTFNNAERQIANQLESRFKSGYECEIFSKDVSVISSRGINLTKGDYRGVKTIPKTTR